MEAAKGIVIEKQNQTQKYFNSEASSLFDQYRRSLDLIDFYEKVIKEQTGVIALQEKTLSKVSYSFFTKLSEQEATF